MCARIAFYAGCALVLLAVGFAGVGHAQDKKTFPTKDEINLLLTQAGRAVQLYKPLIDQEEILLGKSADYAEAVSRDRQVLSALEMAMKALKQNPEGFNGPAGFVFFMWLDDADRNALLCHSGALSLATEYAMAGDMDKANNLIHFSRTCMDASVLLNTVGENAASLYQRYVEAENKLMAEGFETTQRVSEALKRCTEVLKKSCITPKK
jgi:hypothetical protein